MLLCDATDTKNIYQKVTASQPPVSVSRSSSDLRQQRVDVESNANAVSSAGTSSPAVAKNSPTRLDGGQSNAVDSDGRLSDVCLPEGLGVVMVERVRGKTGLSHSQSQLAVATVLGLLAERVPATEKLVTAILDDIHHQHVCILSCFDNRPLV